MRELLGDLDDLVGTPTGEELRSDRARRLIAERILTQLIDIAVGVNSHLAAVQLGRAPRDHRESFDMAAEAAGIPTEVARSLRDAAGLRNVLVHAYLEIDLDLVAAAVPRARESFASYIRAVAAFLAAS